MIVLLYTTRAMVIWVFFGCQRISSVAGCSAWAGSVILAEGAGLSDAQQFDVRGPVALGPIDDRGAMLVVCPHFVCISGPGWKAKAEDV